MMDKDDDIKRVRELLNAYGANRARWPEGSATGGLAPRENLGEAQVHFQETLALDKLLDEAALTDPSLEITADILANTSPNLG